MPQYNRLESVLDVLRRDHAHVHELFTSYQRMALQRAPSEQRKQLASRICEVLSAETQAKDELFYPALRANVSAAALLNQAEVGNDVMRALIAELEDMAGTESLFDATVTALGDCVALLVHDEENLLFPLAQASGLDLLELGGEFKARQEALEPA